MNEGKKKKNDKWYFNWAFQRESCTILCEEEGAEKKAKELIQNSFKKDADEWLAELSKMSKEAFLSMREMNAGIEVGILVHKGNPLLPSVNEVSDLFLVLLMEGEDK